VNRFAGRVEISLIENSIFNDRESSVEHNDIEEIKKRSEQATPGPLRSFVEKRDNISGSDFIMTAQEDIYLTGATIAEQDFIAHARQDNPRLIAEVERLRAEALKLRGDT
jgi:hypothetical protein